MKWMLPVLVGAAFVLIAGPIVLARIARRWGANDIEIKGYTYRFKGLDEPLRKRTEARRKLAEAIKRDGLTLDTRDDQTSRIHLAG